MALPQSVIYDFGANIGDNLPYYLLKAHKVVAVEANPRLAQGLRVRFASEIAQGRVVVENCIVTDGESSGPQPFYVHRQQDILSQFPRPAGDVLHEFDVIELPCRQASRIVQEHGEPHYIKIDIEHHDAAILRNLFAKGIRPPFISAESHHFEVLALLAGEGGYRSFNLVTGHTVSSQYTDHRIQTLAGPQAYSFPFHSAGPFGEDIAQRWMHADDFFKYLALVGLGWKDVHATTLIAPCPPLGAELDLVLRSSLLRSRIRRALPAPVLGMIRSVRRMLRATGA